MTAEVLTHKVPCNCERCGEPLAMPSGYCGTGLCQRCATGGIDRPEMCEGPDESDWNDEDIEPFDDDLDWLEDDEEYL